MQNQNEMIGFVVVCSNQICLPLSATAKNGWHSAHYCSAISSAAISRVKCEDIFLRMEWLYFWELVGWVLLGIAGYIIENPFPAI